MRKIINIFNRKKTKNKETEKNAKIYDTLSPTLLKVEDIKTYIKAIDEALGNKENKNIAITGAYGSGKSSIIKTYQSLRSESQFLNISLANFKIDSVDDEGKYLTSSEENNLNRLLELSILQQIFYHVEKKQIPDSRFKRINSLSHSNIFWFVLGAIIWLISYSWLFHFELILRWFPKIEKTIILQSIAILLFVTGIGFTLANLRRVFNNSKINKFNIQNGDFEIDEHIDRSIINKHLDEIIYFFQATDYRIVVIEDLDRFNSTEIFSKLREINLLLNNSEQIVKNKKPIVFIYAIRDDMFIDRDRVKFFDFIIPVIPIINPSNSNDILLEKLETLNDNKPSEELINGISYYIDDMRLLKNIWNEYLTYRDILKDSLSQDKLFTLITYKNFYPDDFVALHTNKSKISEIFEKRQRFENQLNTKINAEIENLRSELKEIDRQRHDDEKELRSIYMSKIIEVYPNTIGFAIDGVFYSIKEFYDEENFTQLTQSHSLDRAFNENVRYSNNTTYGSLRTTRITFEFSEIETKVNPKISFENRMRLIKKDYSHRDEVLSKIKLLQEKKNTIRNYSLEELLKDQRSEDLLAEHQSNKLLIYMITNGYVDKYYSQYISYFHGVSLSNTDFDFLLALRNGVALDYGYELKHISNLARKIEPKYYQSKAILNYNLFDYWFSNSVFKYQQKSIIELLSQQSRESIYFLKSLPENTTKLDKFTSIATTEWDDFWKHLEEQLTYSEDIREVYFKSILINGDIESLVQQHKNSSLKDYIENKDSFLTIFPDKKHFKHLEDLLHELSIEFQNLSVKKNALMDYIYDTNRYKFNENNLKAILEFKKTYISLGYLDILNSGLEQLNEYLQVDIEEYVQNILLDMQILNEESSEGIILLLNNDGLSEQLKKTIIEKLISPIPTLESIKNDDLKQKLLENLKVTATWQNVLHYFEESDSTLNEVLIKFLNTTEVYNSLSKTKLKTAISNKEKRSALANAIILENSIALDAYSNLLKASDFTFTNLNLDGIDENKVSFLVQSKALKLSKANFDYLKDNFPSEHLKLIELSPSTFISDLSNYFLSDNEIDYLLKSDKFDLEGKIEIYKKQVNTTVLERTENISDSVSDVLVRANLKVDFEILKLLIKNTKSIELRIKLLNQNIDKLEKQEVYSLIRLLPSPYSRIAIKRKKPTFEINDYNKKLAEELQKLDLISSYKEEKKELRIYAKSSI